MSGFFQYCHLIFFKILDQPFHTSNGIFHFCKMEQDVLIVLLKKLEQIITLSQNEIKAACIELPVKALKKGDYLISEGETCSSVYFIHKGLLRAYLNLDAKEAISEFFFEGGFAGTFTAFSLKQVTRLNVQALEDSVLVEFQEEWLEYHYKKAPSWLGLGKYIFEEAFVKKCQRESSFLSHSATQRYFFLIDQYPSIEERVSLHQIASYLGIRPESLSRIRSGKFVKNLM